MPIMPPYCVAQENGHGHAIKMPSKMASRRSAIGRMQHSGASHFAQQARKPPIIVISMRQARRWRRRRLAAKFHWRGHLTGFRRAEKATILISFRCCLSRTGQRSGRPTPPRVSAPISRYRGLMEWRIIGRLLLAQDVSAAAGPRRWPMMMTMPPQAPWPA